MHARSSFIVGLMALALAVAPALCCCVSTARGDDGSNCGGASCDASGESPAGPVTPDEPCSGDHTPEMKLTTTSAVGKAYALASDEHGQPGAIAIERTRGGFISVRPVAPGQWAARAGPLVSLQSLRTLLLN